MGGQWMGARQPEIANLAQDLGIGTFRTYNAGKRLIDRNGDVRSHPVIRLAHSASATPGSVN